MYCQIDGVAMGSLLHPILANIFVEFQVQLLFDRLPKPVCYFHYLDDIVVICSSRAEAVKTFKVASTYIDVKYRG